MYKFLIHKAAMPKGQYNFFTETIEIADEETGAVVKQTKEYSTEELTELEEKYAELLKTYTTEQVIPVEVLKADFAVDITDVASEE